MALDFVADFTATGFSKSVGRALDAAAGGAVRVKRRGEVYVLLRAQHLQEIVRDAANPRPRTLEDMLVGYDAGRVKGALAGWLADAPHGREPV